jgi:glutathione S-transferase
VSEHKIIVYGPPGSPIVEKVMLGLAFKKLGEPHVEAPQNPEDFRRWNPETGMLPVMDFDGVRVPDSGGILDWLDARFPDPPLLARDPWTARQQRQLESWIGESFYFYWVRWLRAHVVPTEVDPAKSGDLARMGILGRMTEVLANTPSLPGDLGPEFERRLDDLVSFLGGRPFFHADRPSRADLTAAAFLGSLEAGSVPGGPRLLRARPPLVDLMARVREATRVSPLDHQA